MGTVWISLAGWRVARNADRPIGKSGGMTAPPINIAQRQGSSGSSFGVMGSPSKPKGAGGNLSAAGVVGDLTPKGGLEEDFAELSGMWGNK